MRLNLRTMRYLLIAYCLCDWLAGYAGIIEMTQAQAAGFTVVTGTVVDPNGIPYANGTITAQLVSSGAPTLNGQPYQPPTQPSGLNGAGTFAMNIADTTILLPAGSHWNFLVNCGTGCVPVPGGTGPVSFTLAAPITISGASQDISTQLNAVAPPLTANASGQLPLTVATLPAGLGVAGRGQLRTVKDGNAANDCSVGGGTNAVTCIWTGAAWAFAGNSAAAPGFALITTGTNTVPLHVGTGGTLDSTGSGTISANLLAGLTNIPFVGTNGSNTPVQAPCTATQILVGNSSNFAVCQALTGDSSITNAGVMTNKGMNGVLLSSLATGIYKNTTGSGIPSIAVAGDFPLLNQSTTGQSNTALALAAAPTNCPINSATTGILANGNAQNCFTPAAAPNSLAVGNIPVASTVGATYLAQPKMGFDIRDCTVGVCGVAAGPQSDFCGAINGASLQTTAAIDARFAAWPGQSSFATVNTLNGVAGVIEVMCLSDMGKGTASGVGQNIYFGNYLIVASVPQTTSGAATGMHGFPVGSTNNGAAGVGTRWVVCNQSGGCPVSTVCPGAGCVPQFSQTPLLAAGGPFLGTPVCSTLAAGTLNCSGSDGSSGITSIGGAVACPNPLPPAINQANPGNNNCHVVTGNGTTWLNGGAGKQVAVGSMFVSCDTGGGQTCPSSGNASSSFVVAVTTNTSITIIGSWAGISTANTATYIYPPTITPVIFWEGAYNANSTSRDGFGDIFEDIQVDCEGLPNCVGIYSTNAQERDVLRHFATAFNVGIFPNGTTFNSTTSNTIGTGPFTFTTNLPMGLTTDHTVRLADHSNPNTNFIIGTVTSDVGNTLVIQSTGAANHGGSGTFVNWDVIIYFASTSPNPVVLDNTKMAGYFFDRSLQETGISGPAHFQLQDSEFNVGAGYNNDEVNYGFGYVFAGWDVLRGIPTDMANSAVGTGSANGKIAPSNIGNSVWVDGVYRLELGGGHVEFAANDFVNVAPGAYAGAGNGTYNVEVHSFSAANQTSTVVHFGTGIVASRARQISTINNNQNLMKDDSPGGLTIQSKTCSNSSFNISCVLFDYGSGGLWLGGNGMVASNNTRKIVGANLSNAASATPVTVVTWPLPVSGTTALVSYGFRCDLTYENATGGGTGGLQLGVNLSAAPSALGLSVFTRVETAGAGTNVTGYINNASTGHQNVGTGAAATLQSTPYMATIYGTIEGANTAGGTFTIDFAPTVNAQTILIMRGTSTCNLWPVVN